MASAFTAASFIDTPYRSMGSVSPRIADASASTASFDDPPNCAARSAPRPINVWVCPVKSLMPLFFRSDPSVAARSLYCDFVMPRFDAASFDACLIAAACPLNTASTAPTDCSRSDAPLIASPKNFPTPTTPAAAASGANSFAAPLSAPPRPAAYPAPAFVPDAATAPSALATSFVIAGAIALVDGTRET